MPSFLRDRAMQGDMDDAGMSSSDESSDGGNEASALEGRTRLTLTMLRIPGSKLGMRIGDTGAKMPHVDGVTTDGIAATAGVQTGDYVIEVNGTRVKYCGDLSQEAAKAPPMFTMVVARKAVAAAAPFRVPDHGVD